jgi:nucleotide-binding universal stress UspA family protein
MRFSTRSGSTSGPASGALLYVTDVVMSDSDEGLDAACELADRTGSHLELIHVVDLVHAPSKPDAHMGIQYRLEMLARKLQHLKRNVASILLFGSPEEVISKRAVDIKARLIVFGRNGSSSTEAQNGLVRRIMRRVTCPVVFLPSTAVELSNKGLREPGGEAYAMR